MTDKEPTKVPVEIGISDSISEHYREMVGKGSQIMVIPMKFSLLSETGVSGAESLTMFLVRSEPLKDKFLRAVKQVALTEDNKVE